MSLGAPSNRDQNRGSFLLDTSRPSADGRHLRSERSRQKIVNALTEIIRDGTMEPTQAEVAERAKVSFRTVSRHFEDMESLFRLCVRQIQTELLDQFLAPFDATDWRGRVDELIRRRAEGYDVFLPYRVFAAVRRFRSDFMRHIHDDSIVFDVTSMTAVLPPEIKDDAVLVDALENALSFESWARLRQGRQLSSERALAVFRQTASSLLAPFED
ncbi:MAG: TetR/AcrR family transcriptional regulator [Pseudomonadota bacterium]